MYSCKCLSHKQTKQSIYTEYMCALNKLLSQQTNSHKNLPLSLFIFIHIHIYIYTRINLHTETYQKMHTSKSICLCISAEIHRNDIPKPNSSIPTQPDKLPKPHNSPRPYPVPKAPKPTLPHRKRQPPSVKVTKRGPLHKNSMSQRNVEVCNSGLRKAVIRRDKGETIWVIRTPKPPPPTCAPSHNP